MYLAESADGLNKELVNWTGSLDGSLVRKICHWLDRCGWCFNMLVASFYEPKTGFQNDKPINPKHSLGMKSDSTRGK